MRVYGKYECFRHADVVCLCPCVYHVAVLNVAFCMTCNLLILPRIQEATIWKRHTPDPVPLLSYR